MEIMIPRRMFAGIEDRTLYDELWEQQGLRPGAENGRRGCKRDNQTQITCLWWPFDERRGFTASQSISGKAWFVVETSIIYVYDFSFEQPLYNLCSYLLRYRLNRSARNEEPLVNAWVNWSRSLVVTSWNVELAGVGLVLGVTDSGVDARQWSVMIFKLQCFLDSQRNVTLVGLASDKLLPCLSALPDDIHGVLLVLALAGEGELVLWLSVWDLVDAEPFVGGAEETWQVALDVLNVVQLWRQWVVDVDDDDLPVGLALVEQSHDSKNLDLLDLAGLGDGLTDLADIQWVVVTLGLGLWVGDVWVLPCLWCVSMVGRAWSAKTVD